MLPQPAVATPLSPGGGAGGRHNTRRTTLSGTKYSYMAGGNAGSGPPSPHTTALRFGEPTHEHGEGKGGEARPPPAPIPRTQRRSRVQTREYSRQRRRSKPQAVPPQNDIGSRSQQRVTSTVGAPPHRGAATSAGVYTLRITEEREGWAQRTHLEEDMALCGCVDAERESLSTGAKALYCARSNAACRVRPALPSLSIPLLLCIAHTYACECAPRWKPRPHRPNCRWV